VIVDVGPVGHGGICIGHAEDGRAVLIRHALPGERVRVRVTEERSSYLRVDAVEVLDASPHRVTPPCPWSGPGRCGGCDWQHVALDEQRRLKASVVSEQLRRIAGLDVPVVVEAVPGDSDGLGWRTRVRLAVDSDGVAGLRRHRSHEVEAIGDCLIAHPSLPVASVVGQRWPGNDGVDLVRSDVEHAAGRDWRVPEGGFWQVHPGAADALAAAVLEAAQARPGDVVLDLYAGVGLFAGVLAPVVVPGRVHAVESDRAAIVVLDPPRKGAGRAVIDGIAAAGPRRVVHVACDPASLARDVALLAGHGYALDGLRAFDLFPMTAHVECVATLVRADRS
jgi:tRNA/tmRNA/rRNA uracil-C5-methylase (TrmA/RlmC/RlmD family)